MRDAAELHLELLLGRRVVAEDGRPVGRIEELRAEARGDETVVTEYHVGSYAVLERLSAWSLGRAVLRLVAATGRGGGYRVPWDKLDLSDPERPRLTCPVGELRPLRPT